MSTYTLYERRFPGLMVLFAALTLAACAGQQPIEEDIPPPSDSREPASEQWEEPEQFTAEQLNQRGLLGIERDDRAQFLDPANPLSTRTIYFEFDSSRIQSRFADAIAAHARYLAEHPDIRLRLEGHTDERGTREYNVALGERRAESVEKALVLGGAQASQLTTLSFGEERPAELGSSEAAYAKNRRVELIYIERR